MSAARVAKSVSVWAALWAVALAVVMVPLLSVYPWDGGHGRIPDPLAWALIAYGYATSGAIAYWLYFRMHR